jgi:hypothetical protein
MTAALHVASILDPRGSRVGDAFESYWHHATGGSFAPGDLKRGEALLIATGLVIERDGVLYPIEEMKQLLDGSAEDASALLAERVLASEAVGPATVQETELAALVPDPDRREELLLALRRTFDDTARRALGAAGEELVLAAARQELAGLGYAQLAREVRRVSLLSDQLGYDISAPRVSGPRRLLEVKATSVETNPLTFHLSRNEAETAAKFSDWFLVVCLVEEVDAPTGRILGWVRPDDIDHRLPADTEGGRWEQATLTMPLSELTPGLPRAVS